MKLSLATVISCLVLPFPAFYDLVLLCVSIPSGFLTVMMETTTMMLMFSMATVAIINCSMIPKGPKYPYGEYLPKP